MENQSQDKYVVDKSSLKQGIYLRNTNKNFRLSENNAVQ